MNIQDLQMVGDPPIWQGKESRGSSTEQWTWISKDPSFFRFVQTENHSLVVFSLVSQCDLLLAQHQWDTLSSSAQLLILLHYSTVHPLVLSLKRVKDCLFQRENSPSFIHATEASNLCCKPSLRVHGPQIRPINPQRLTVVGLVTAPVPWRR